MNDQHVKTYNVINKKNGYLTKNLLRKNILSVK